MFCVDFNFQYYSMSLFFHHAYLLSAPREMGIVRVKEVLANAGMTVVGNPDVRVWNEESFSVDTARQVRDAAATRPLGERQVFIVAGDTFTLEAQNALLKTLEEPGEETHIVVITPNAGILLPTLLSRLTSFDKKSAVNTPDTDGARTFLTLFVSKRLAHLEKMIKDKDKTVALGLLEGLMSVIHNDAIHSGADAVNASAPYLRELSDMRAYLTDRSSSIKLIMEHIALFLSERK